MNWTFRITHLDANNVPNATFTLDLKPGMTVTDRTAAFFPVMYTVPAGRAKQIDSTVSNAVARATALLGEQTKRPSLGRTWLIFAVANFVLVGALATALLVRRRRSTRRGGAKNT